MVDNISSSRYIAHVRLNGQMPPPTVSAQYVSGNGILIQADCLDLLANMASGTVDMVFVDPPFNLGKTYEDPELKDQFHDEFYRGWCKTWLLEAIRVLRPGGSLFLYHLPKWLMDFGAWLNMIPQVQFRNWIALKMKNGFPIRRRLHPAHYGLLYYTKMGAEPTFNIVRSKSPSCRKCKTLLRDYGGYREKYKKYEDEDGVPWVQISDFWEDTRPATHDKTRSSSMNELPLHVPERAILMATKPGDVILDFFAGSGSTIHAAERAERSWICADVAYPGAALKRLATFVGVTESASPASKVLDCFQASFVNAILPIDPASSERPVKGAGKLAAVDQNTDRFKSKSKLLGI